MVGLNNVYARLFPKDLYRDILNLTKTRQAQRQRLDTPRTTQPLYQPWTPCDAMRWQMKSTSSKLAER